MYCDDNNNLINVTLWSKYAITLDKFLSENKGPVIFAMQFAKYNIFHGGFSVSNSFFASRFLMNPDIPEVKDFLERWVIVKIRMF
ncbi:hypothetical protein vseg_007822 [Gypsophila vaccaria]